MHIILLHTVVCALCLDSCVRLLEGLSPNLSYYSIIKVAIGGSEWRALLEQCLEGLRRELQDLQSQVQEQAQAQIQTGPRKCSAASGLHQELQNE